MKLKELLARCDFDSIVPHLLRIYPRHATQLPWYKEAYDILRHTESVDNDGTIRIAWCNDDVKYGGEPYIHINNCEGQSWEGCLGAQLDVADDVHIADAELAARCLWSLTFYGFRPDECDYFDCYRAPRNPYEEQAKRLEDAQFRTHSSETMHANIPDASMPFRRKSGKYTTVARVAATGRNGCATTGRRCGSNS